MAMNITREVLLEPLQKVIGVVEQKQAMPILSNVLLEISDNQLSVTATDLEVELIGKSNLIIAPESDHKITLSAKKLSDITKALPENSVIQLHKQKEQMIIQSGASRFALSTLPPTDFPTMGEMKSVASFSIEQDRLAKILQRTTFAMSQDDVRIYLNAVLLEIADGSIKSVASDGHRLAFNSVSAKNDYSGNIQAIIPRKAVLQLTKILGSSTDKVEIHIGNNFLKAVTDEYILTTRLVEHKYPEYRKVIPKNPTIEITMQKNDFKLALQRTAILSNERFRGIKLEFKPSSLKITASNPEHEAAEEEIVTDYQGSDFSICLNVNYLLDNINIFKKDQIKLHLTDETSPIIIEEVDGEHESTFVIMPLRL
jgi:DNA polymerase III subunit beta